MRGVDVRLITLCFIHEIWGASLKTLWPKPSLGKKDQVRKKSTPRVTSIQYSICLNWNKTWDGTHSMYWVSLRLIIVQAYTLLLQHLHVFGTGRPNWQRTFHPSFLHCWPFSKLSLPSRTILSIGSHYTFWSFSIWQLICTYGLFLLTRVGSRGGCSCFGDFELGHIVLGAGMVRQFRLVSRRLRRILG